MKARLEETLRKPLQALIIANEKNKRTVLNGAQKIIIEREWIDYSKGFALLCCPPNELCLGVMITDVRHCLAEEITEDESKDYGFVNYPDMINDMKRYYNDFNDKIKVTVTRWKDLDFGITNK